MRTYLLKRYALITGIVTWGMLNFSCRITDTSPQIFFECTDYDFGEVPDSDTLFFEFKFRNLGQEDLAINNVKTGCWCTVANWIHAPIKKAESGSILIKYKDSYPSVFKEVIYVYHNGKDSPTRITVRGKTVTNKSNE